MFIQTLLIYSFFGAVFEHLSYYFNPKIKKTLSNPIITGFPIYGLGAYLILKTGIKNTFLLFIVSALIGTIIELLTGIIVKAGPQGNIREGNTVIVDSWDYSDNILNYKGIIDIKHSLLFGLLGVILVYIHPNIISFLSIS